MSVQTQIHRLTTAKSDLRTLLQQNGVTVPAATTLEGYPALFDALLQSGAAYLYKATFLVDGWQSTGSGGYSQQAALQAVAGAPSAAPQGVMASCLYIEDDYTDGTAVRLCKNLGMLNRARKALNPVGDGAVQGYRLQCTTRNGEKPDTDIEVYLLAK